MRWLLPLPAVMAPSPSPLVARLFRASTSVATPDNPVVNNVVATGGRLCSPGLPSVLL